MIKSEATETEDRIPPLPRPVPITQFPLPPRCPQPVGFLYNQDFLCTYDSMQTYLLPHVLCTKVLQVK